jgi:hypothetical protein
MPLCNGVLQRLKRPQIQTTWRHLDRRVKARPTHQFEGGEGSTHTGELVIYRVTDHGGESHGVTLNGKLLQYTFRL